MFPKSLQCMYCLFGTLKEAGEGEIKIEGFHHRLPFVIKDPHWSHLFGHILDFQTRMFGRNQGAPWTERLDTPNVPLLPEVQFRTSIELFVVSLFYNVKILLSSFYNWL